MFIDASAAVAIILDEPDWEVLRKKLKSSSRRYMSAIADYEAAMAVKRMRKISALEAYAVVYKFQEIFRIQNLKIEDKHSKAALSAFERFGKGQGHDAGLNMGDCFSYACAELQRVPLLFKGNDFTHTDIQSA